MNTIYCRFIFGFDYIFSRYFNFQYFKIYSTLLHITQYVSNVFYSSVFLVAGQSPKYVFKGREVILSPGITGHPEDILWKHNGSKLVEFDGQEQQEYDPFKGRITLDWQTAELTITDLKFEDSGDFELEAYINRALHTSQFKIKVIGKLLFN